MKPKKFFLKLAVIILGLFALVRTSYAFVSVGSAQFAAKLYSEALGRIPDQEAWRWLMDVQQKTPCSSTSLAELAKVVLTSDEFLRLAPNSNERLFKLYRAVLHRDPDQGGFNYFNQLLKDGHTSWQQVVSDITSSTEFMNRASFNCGNKNFGWQFALPFNMASPISPNLVFFNNTDGAQLQYALNNVSQGGGGTVYLNQGLVVLINQPLKVPNNVTLTTYGVPGRHHADKLGRLARNAAFNNALVQLSDNTKLNSVWVDGQRNRFPRGVPGSSMASAINVLASGSNIEVSNNLITDAPGGTSLKYNGGIGEGYTCTNGVVTDNLITAYGSSHYEADNWTDGLTIACEDSLIDRNEIIDATDVSIVLFRAKGSRQRSIVSNNLSLNAGNSAFSAIALDTFYGVTGKSLHDFTGTKVINNTFWSSPVAHTDIGLSIGTRAWFGNNADTGKGAIVTGNTTGTQKLKASVGINIGQMLETTVQNNTLLISPTVTHCPNVNVAAAVSAGYASGNLQPYTDRDIGQCISIHPKPVGE